MLRPVNRHLQEAERLLRAGLFEEAIGLCRKSLRLNRDTAIAMRILADCHYNLGVAKLDASGTSAAARAEFQRAYELDATHANAASNLGASLVRSGDYEDGLQWMTRAARAAPQDTRFALNVASTLVLLQDLQAASRELRVLADMNPSNAGAYLLAESLLVAEITPDAGYPTRIREEVMRKLQRLRANPAPIADPLELSASYFPLSYHGLSNVDINRALAAAYLAGCPSLEWRAPQVAAWRGPGERMKVGFASRFFRNHSISNTTRGLIAHLDRARFEAIVVRFEPSPGDEAARAVDAVADRVVTLPGSTRLGKGHLQSAREAIAALGLDVLFYQDVGLEPLSYFLAFARLAPVQLTSFGHPDTTGIPNMDYFVSAELYERAGAQSDYSEQLVMLPDVGTLSYYHRPPAPPAPAPREELALEPEDHVYFCPQTLQKIQPAMDDIFLRIAEADAQARIVLIAFDPRRRRALQSRMASLSPLLEARVRFVDHVPYDRFLARIAAADVLLDTVHFNGQNTTLEAFAMGTPVVTLPGELQRARHGLGLAQAAGFTDLVAADAADYAAKAVRVARDPAFRARCRDAMAAGSQRVFEDMRFVRHMETALTAMVAESRARDTKGR
jgi:predicted O-linked N-acetylglucosamine transferase (SPINDLY family)